MINLRSLVFVVCLLVAASTAAAVTVYVVLPSAAAIPVIALIGTVASSTLAPIITNLVVSNIVKPVKTSQDEIHSKIDKIEKDVNGTAAMMARQLEDIRARNIVLEREIARQSALKNAVPSDGIN